MKIGMVNINKFDSLNDVIWLDKEAEFDTLNGTFKRSTYGSDICEVSFDTKEKIFSVRGSGKDWMIIVLEDTKGLYLFHNYRCTELSTEKQINYSEMPNFKDFKYKGIKCTKSCHNRPNKFNCQRCKNIDEAESIIIKLLNDNQIINLACGIDNLGNTYYEIDNLDF